MNFESNSSSVKPVASGFEDVVLTDIFICFLNKKGLNHKKVLLSVEVCFNFFFLTGFPCCDARRDQNLCMIFITMALKIKCIDLDMINSNSVKNKVSELDKKSGRQFS